MPNTAPAPAASTGLPAGHTNGHAARTDPGIPTPNAVLAALHDPDALTALVADLDAAQMAELLSDCQAAGPEYIARRTVPCPAALAAWIKVVASATEHEDLGRTVANALLRGAADMPRTKSRFISL